MDFEALDEELIADPEFVESQWGTKYGKRANWSHKSAMEAFKEVKEEFPDWTVPKIRELVRKTEKDVDYEVEKQWDGMDGWTDCEDWDDGDDVGYETDYSDEEVYDYENDIDVDDEPSWYEQAATRMSRQVIVNKIKVLKHRYHLAEGGDFG